MGNVKGALKSPLLWVGVALGWLVVPQVRKVIGR